MTLEENLPVEKVQVLKQETSAKSGLINTDRLLLALPLLLPEQQDLSYVVSVKSNTFDWFLRRLRAVRSLQFPPLETEKVRASEDVARQIGHLVTHGDNGRKTRHFL